MPLPKRLLDGYTHFRNGRYAADAQRYRELGQGQQPAKIMIIACCDSRTAPETVFDAAPGEIFVARNVANLVPPYTPDDSHHATSAALEFAVLSLGVEHIAIMGHGRCGGIRAAVSEDGPLTHTDFIGSWTRAIKDVAGVVGRPAGIRDAEHERLIERATIEHSLANLRTFPWVRVRESRGELALHGVWFDVSLGELHALNQANGQWVPVSVVAA
jgi:carbonic anhydrase